MVEYHAMVIPGDQKMKPIFKVNAITYRHDPILSLCVCRRATEENHSVWEYHDCRRVLNICQAVGLSIKMVWCRFESHVMWFVVQVNRQKLRVLNTNIPDFSRKGGDTIFDSKPGWYTPKYSWLVTISIPQNCETLPWRNPLAANLVFEEYGNIPLIPCVGHEA